MELGEGVNEKKFQGPSKNGTTRVERNEGSKSPHVDNSDNDKEV